MKKAGKLMSLQAVFWTVLKCSESTVTVLID